MKLSISNIAWDIIQDKKVYALMQKYGFTGLEIAPTKIFPKNPYEQLKEAETWSTSVKSFYGLTISSIQSIWYGRNENLFGTKKEQETLIQYTKKAIRFAEAIGCKNLVFGCPKNRSISEHINPNLAIPFFKELGDYAAKHGTVLAMEANPAIYHTNYINYTVDAIELIQRVNSLGFLLNLDIGTMIENQESVEELKGNVGLINHIHISEPGLMPIQKRELYQDLLVLLKNEGYEKYISIEMKKQEDMAVIEDSLLYIRSVFH